MKKVSAKSLSTAAKIDLFIAQNLWNNCTLNGAIPLLFFNDGPLGVRKPIYNEKKEYTHTQQSIAYPSSEVLAATWNLSLAKRYGECLANDCIDLGVDVILGPGVNIKRLPLNGRNFEYYSEDPLLSGLFSKEYIKGVQSHHIGTSLKHYCCYNSETSRNYLSVEIDQRTLHEIYLKSFQIALSSKPWTVMTSYNKVNGVKVCQDPKLLAVLRKDFHYNGLIISDWDSIFDSKEALHAGIDIEFPYNKGHLESLKNSINEINIKRLNDASKRLLNLCYKNEKAKAKRCITISQKERENLAQKVAEEGIILLKNKNHVLPLHKNSSIHCFGQAFHRYSSGGGSSRVIPVHQTLLHEALKQKGFETITNPSEVEEQYLKYDFEYLKNNHFDISLISVGENEKITSENFNRKTARLSEEEETLIKEIAKRSSITIVILEGGGCIEMNEWLDSVDGLIYAGFSGQEGNIALANILQGTVNPSGHLAETFPIHINDFLSSVSSEAEEKVKYEEGLLVGYRQFVSKGQEVLFPFGFGLSYSSFEYSNFEVIQKEQNIEVTFKIKNTSSVDGQDVAQIYVQEMKPSVVGPTFELRGFKKIFVIKKKTKNVKIIIPVKELSYYDVKNKKWTYNQGKYRFMLGTSSTDIKLTSEICIK